MAIKSSASIRKTTSCFVYHCVYCNQQFAMQIAMFFAQKNKLNIAQRNNFVVQLRIKNFK